MRVPRNRVPQLLHPRGLRRCASAVRACGIVDCACTTTGSARSGGRATTRERHAKHVTVAVYLGLPKESGGLFQHARTVLHSLARRSDHAERLVALSSRGTEWGAICASIGVEWHEADDLTLAQRVAGRLLGGRVPRHRWARAAMPRVKRLGNERTSAWGPKQFSQPLWSIVDTVVASAR